MEPRRLRNPLGKRHHELRDELPGFLVLKLTLGVEQLCGTSDIGLGLLHDGHVEKNEGLAERVIGTEGAKLIGRDADNRGGPSNTLLPWGREPTSMAFFRPPGTERLYSGVTNSTASVARISSRKRVQLAGGSASTSSL